MLPIPKQQVTAEDLNSQIAYIQITYVKPYFDDKELESRKTSYERSNNIRRFVYETPYTQDGKAMTEKVEEQYKRKTIVTSKLYCQFQWNKFWCYSSCSVCVC